MKKWIAFVLAAVCLLSFTGCENKSEKDKGIPQDAPYFAAEILEIHDTYFLVQPSAGMEELKSADKIEVPNENADKDTQFQIGDLILIVYDGMIMETYPARLNQVYRIGKLELRFTEENG